MEEKTAAGEKNKDNQKSNNVSEKMEAILFASGEPVKISKLAQFLKISRKLCQEELEKIADFYDKNNRGLGLLFKSEQAQMVSAPVCGKEVSEFLNKELNEGLSRAALEVLSVIAYRGPISRADIEYIRGVNCSFTLRNLAMRGLIDRSENPNDSRAYLYEISFDLLKNLGLSKINELPDYEDLSRKMPEQEKKEEGIEEKTTV